MVKVFSAIPTFVRPSSSSSSLVSSTIDCGVVLDIGQYYSEQFAVSKDEGASFLFSRPGDLIPIFRGRTSVVPATRLGRVLWGGQWREEDAINATTDGYLSFPIKSFFEQQQEQGQRRSREERDKATWLWRWMTLFRGSSSNSKASDCVSCRAKGSNKQWFSN